MPLLLALLVVLFLGRSEKIAKCYLDFSNLGQSQWELILWRVSVPYEKAYKGGTATGIIHSGGARGGLGGYIPLSEHASPPVGR